MKLHPLPLVFVALAGCAADRPGLPPTQGTQAAVLGIETSAPTTDEALRLDLPRTERWQGRRVESVAPGGAAAEAGIRRGDVILAIGGVELFSQDDLEDFLTAERRDSRVVASLKHSDGRVESVEVALRSSPARAGLCWHYASLGQLPAALKEAEKTRKSILVGLSGAET